MRSTPQPPAEVVAPGKVLRLASMVDALVEELHTTTLDGATRTRIRSLYGAALIEVGSTLSDPLLEELAHLQPGRQGSSDDELRVLIAQLAGWLHGLCAGLAAAEVPFLLVTEPELEPDLDVA